MRLVFVDVYSLGEDEEVLVPSYGVSERWGYLVLRAGERLAWVEFFRLLVRQPERLDVAEVLDERGLRHALSLLIGAGMGEPCQTDTQSVAEKATEGHHGGLLHSCDKAEQQQCKREQSARKESGEHGGVLGDFL